MLFRIVRQGEETMLQPQNYHTWIFDCDGVLLDSNRCKANAFYKAALPYGTEIANQIATYHKDNGGISRFKKFRYVFENLLGRTDYEAEYERMVQDFSRAAREELQNCKPVAGVEDFLKSAPAGTRLFVISGAEEEELKWSLEIHGLAKYFHGIFGSPRSKTEILNTLAESRQLVGPTVYFGDSRYDFLSASQAGCDFLFVNGFTDFANWQTFVQENNIPTARDFTELLQKNKTPALERLALAFTPPPLRSLVSKHWNFLFYSLIGVSGASLDYILFVVLHSLGGMDKYFANALSVTAGISNNFVLNAFLNFKQSDRLLQRFAYFYATGIAGLVLSNGILFLGVDKLEFNAPAVKFFSIFFVVLLQYNLNKKLAFKK
jgi:phosphoglycolate phosphatase-like HAD superfamily hydrolase/putative flippase GtrA